MQMADAALDCHFLGSTQERTYVSRFDSGQSSTSVSYNCSLIPLGGPAQVGGTYAEPNHQRTDTRQWLNTRLAETISSSYASDWNPVGHPVYCKTGQSYSVTCVLRLTSYGAHLISDFQFGRSKSTTPMGIDRCPNRDGYLNADGSLPVQLLGSSCAKGLFVWPP